MAENSPPVLRFAPSPTGYLHIGGARTALFNWLYAQHSGGKFLLRIEDTDRERSTPEAVAAIFNGLIWLGLNWDGEPLFQFARADRHREVARELLSRDRAYRCYATPQELEQMRAEQKSRGLSVRYDGRWRDRQPGPEQNGMPYVIRLKAPLTGETIIEDRVQGTVRWANDQLDDMVLLRSDGTPTYILAVVVDDHDMGVTHVVRGADHLNNAARQLQLIQALDWPAPIYAHVPLIHGPDGAKLSKRHGALAVDAYRDMGYLPEAMRNYLLRLCWSHGDDEIIPTRLAIDWFDLDGIGRSAARFDVKKLDSLNAHYMREMSDGALADEVIAFAQHRTPGRQFGRNAHARLVAMMPQLKPRAKTLLELLDKSEFLFTSGPPPLEPAALATLKAPARKRLGPLAIMLEHSTWDLASLEATTRAFAEKEGIALGDIAQPLRAVLTGRTAAPPVFDILVALGREEALTRIRAQGE